MHGHILAVKSCFPSRLVTNTDLKREYPNWEVETTSQKLGVASRYIAADNEYAVDLAVKAGLSLFSEKQISNDSVDQLILCTQTPDEIVATSACRVHKRLALRSTAGAFEYNLGCSGYVVGLGLAEGLIVSGQARNVLLITADTYSKIVRKDDRNCRLLFGDGATATYIVAKDEPPQLGPFIYGTDGGGSEILRTHGLGLSVCSQNSSHANKHVGLHMDGHLVFRFVLDVVPKAVKELTEKAGISLAQIDRFVFHQANAYILKCLAEALSLAPSKLVVAMNGCGNTVSSSIPIALESSCESGVLKSDMLVMLVGFGAGLSWSATLVKWNKLQASSST